MPNWNNEYAAWFEYHREDYNAVQDRLAACRNVMLHGPIEAAATMLRKAAVNAVLSIQTARERHERAFTAYYASDMSLEDACLQTVYGGQKYKWLQEADVMFSYQNAVERLRDEGAMSTVDKLQSDHKGLGYVKAGFTLAMCGATAVACPDSRTKQVLGIDDRVRSKQQYLDALDMIDEAVPCDVPLFIKQWVCYDWQNQEHADHMPWFTEALQLYERGGA